MSPIDASRKAEIATQYVMNNMYSNFDDGEVFEMRADSSQTHIGIIAKKYGMLGASKSYALVTLDQKGTVTLANKCNKKTMYEEFDRETQSPVEVLEELNENWQTLSNIFFGESDRTRQPSKCPECDAGGFFSFAPPMKELSDQEHQCRKCGHIVRLGENVHMHEHKES